VNLAQEQAPVLAQALEQPLALGLAQGPMRVVDQAPARGLLAGQAR
jgi:hypothetical protein